MNCSKGSYSIEASSSCQACGEGHYSANEGLSECEDCERGRYSNLPIASECQLCSPGSYQDGLQATSCIECSLGHASRNVTGRTTACPICLAGKFAADINGNPTNRSGIHCMNCSAGSYSIEASSSCQACGEGHYSANDGLSECEDCERGRYSNLPIASECQLCSPGSYQDGLQATSCIECSLGHASGNVTGRETECPICLAGKFAADINGNPTNRSGIHCMNCSAGSYSIEASSSCQACGEGHYSANDGLSECEDCERGRYSNLPIASECCSNS